MTFSLLNTKTGVVVSWESEPAITRRTLKAHIDYFISHQSINDEEYCTYLQPIHNCVPSQILHLMPVLVKYSPILTVPCDSDGEYIFFEHNRKMMIFSLKRGDFVSKDDPGLDRQCDLWPLKRGDALSQADTQFLESVRDKWEDKLMLAPFANRNVIRIKSDSLCATDDEMLDETAHRCRLMRLRSISHRIFDDQVRCIQQVQTCKTHEYSPELCVNPVGTALYNIGLSAGYRLAIIKLDGDDEGTQVRYHSRVSRDAIIADYKDYTWVLSYLPHDSSIRMVNRIKSIERGLNIRVFYCNNTITDKASSYCMLYVSRDMSEWGAARERAAAGKPDVCLMNADFTGTPSLTSAEVKVLDDEVFRVL